LEPAGRYYGSFEQWVEVESPQDASVEPPAATGVAAQPSVSSSEPTEMAATAATESPVETETPSEAPAAPARKKGGGHARA
jgi:hypothetical protein